MAYQTSCATIVHEGGVHCETDIVADAEGRELVQHGSALFPIACYAEDLASYSVAWHWHEEFEYILTIQGPLHVDVNKTRLTLQTGQGVFLNSGALHSVEQAEGTALLHSGVFQPRLVGGMDTIFWQKLIRPLLQPGAPAFFLLDEAVPWQKQVLIFLRDAWKEVADEPFDYENRVRYHLSGGAAAAEHPVCGRQDQSLGAGANRLGADEADAPLRGGALRRGADGGEDRGLRGPERERLPAQLRQLLGITPIQYVKQFRVEKAAELLRSTRLKTGEIGLECGFSDGSYFIKTFREIKHCTPREYRTKFC